jgi:hypothetical protein
LIEFSELAEKLDLVGRDTSSDKAARKAWDYLDSHPDSLVIFDNVLEPSELNVPFSPDLILDNLRCRTLFTTRQRDFPHNFQPFEVKVLPEMAAMAATPDPKCWKNIIPNGGRRGSCGVAGLAALAWNCGGVFGRIDVSITGYWNACGRRQFRDGGRERSTRC